MNLQRLVHIILANYALSLRGDHGVAHWARVLENGRRLASASGANLAVVECFAVVHDSQRLNDFFDREHGPRAAVWARAHRDEFAELDDKAFELLCLACHGHTTERFSSDVTIQTCWDADRLDLGRVGITPLASRLGTALAQEKKTIAWADGRARFRIVPDLVIDEWQVDLGPAPRW